MDPLVDTLRHPTATRIVLDESQSAELAQVLEATPSASCFAVVARQGYPALEK